MKAAWLVVGVSSIVFSATKPVEYLDALQLIVERSPSIASQQAKIAKLQGSTLATRLALLPSISLQARQDTRREFGLNEVRSGAAAAVDFNIFRFGSDWAGMTAARRAIEAERVELAQTFLQVEQSGVEALNSWLAAGQGVEILNRVLSWRENLLGIGQKRFERGLVARQEVDKIRIDWENDRALLRDAQNGWIRSTAAVDQLLGHHDVSPQWPWKDRIQRSDTFPENPDVFLKDRPDWKAAELRFEAAQALRSQSWGKMFPSLDLHFSYGYYQAMGASGTINRPEYSSSLVLSVPLFDRLAQFGEYRAQVEGAKIAALDLEKTRREARRQWASAKGSLALAVETAAARDKTLTVARGLYEDNLRRFERGLTEANGLNVDQQRLLQSEQLAIQGWHAAHGTFAGVCFARGLRIKDCL